MFIFYQIKLTKIMTENSTIEVVGHPKKSPNNLKHQTTLPQHHHVTNLLILNFYKLNYYRGSNQTLALLRG